VDGKRCFASNKWEFREQHELSWSYTDKGLPNEVRRESGVPNSSCDEDTFPVFFRNKETKNPSESDILMNSLSTYMSNHMLSVKIDPRLVNKTQELENEALAIANVAAKEKREIESVKEQVRSRKVDEWLKILSNLGVSDIMKGIVEVAIQSLMASKCLISNAVL
jgi:hypothetical protein